MRIKICGITSLEDAKRAAEAGADALGLNFWQGSKRRCDLEVAAAIADELAEKLRLVGVYVDATYDEIEKIRLLTGVNWAQLHGAEAPELVQSLLPRAYKAIGISGSQGLLLERSMPGDEILLDASTGGSGERADWELAAQIASERSLWLAGGLTAENVAEAIERVGPYGVDVASGVEKSPGVKDPDRMKAFVAAVRGTR